MAGFSELISCVILAFKPSHGCLSAMEPNQVSYCEPSHITFLLPLGAVTSLLLEINSPKESKPFLSINFPSFSLEPSEPTIILSKVCHPCIHENTTLESRIIITVTIYRTTQICLASCAGDSVINKAFLPLRSSQSTKRGKHISRCSLQRSVLEQHR